MNGPGEPESLSADDVHLWLAVPEHIQSPELLHAYQELLSDEEREAQKRFYFPRHRHQFLVTRALQRVTLTRYGGSPAPSWVFAKNSHGRPHIAGPGSLDPLHFNVSHTEGLIVCAVARHEAIGVDTETLDRKRGSPHDDLEVAQRFFAPAEVADLEDLRPERRHARFFTFWTLKESYIKARGLGLSLPLDQFAFSLQEGNPGRIGFDPGSTDDAARWCYWLLQPNETHLVAVALAGPKRPLLPRLIVRWTVPLVRDEARAYRLLACSDG